MSKDNTPNGQAKAAEAMPSIDCEQLAGFLFPSAGTTWIERTLFEFINSPHFASVARDLGYWKIKKDGETVQDTVMLPVIPLRDYKALEASLKAKDEEIAETKQLLKAVTSQLDDAMHIIVSYERGTNDEITDEALKNLRKQISLQSKGECV